jgi:hypothetical protein
MYDLARTVGSGACDVLAVFSFCETSEDVIILGFSIIALAGTAAAMFALAQLHRA